MIENARQGFFNGSTPPYGYKVIEVNGTKKQLDVHEDEAAVVKDIFGMYLGSTGKSMGIKSIASALNEKGATIRGEAWKKGSVHIILTRETYIGKHYFNRRDSKLKKFKPEDEWIEISVPSIVDEATYEAVQQRLQSRRFDKTSTKRDDSPTLLTGLLKCKCGAALTLMTGKGGLYKYYRCTSRTNKNNAGCDTPNLPVAEMDKRILSALKDQVFQPERIQKILEELVSALTVNDDGSDDRAKKKLTKELADVRSSLLKLSILFENAAIPLDVLKERSGILTAKQNSIQQQLDALNYKQNMLPPEVTPESLDAFCVAIRNKLDSQDSTFAKEYLKLFVKEIIVVDKVVRIVGNASTVASSLEAESAHDRMTGGANLNESDYLETGSRTCFLSDQMRE
jgi:site-specific DNA recombinase